MCWAFLISSHLQSIAKFFFLFKTNNELNRDVSETVDTQCALHGCSSYLLYLRKNYVYITWTRWISGWMNRRRLLWTDWVNDVRNIEMWMEEKIEFQAQNSETGCGVKLYHFLVWNNLLNRRLINRKLTIKLQKAHFFRSSRKKNGLKGYKFVWSYIYPRFFYSIPETRTKKSL